MDNDAAQVILKHLDTIQNSIDRLDSDLETDRKDIQNFQIRLGNVETEIGAVRDQLHDLPKKVNDEVSDATKSILDEAHDLKQVIRGQKFIAFERPSFINRIIGKVRW